MKVSSLIALTATCLLTAVTVFADPSVGVIVPTATGNGTTYVAGPGDYKNISENTTQITLEQMKQAGVTNEIDRQYVLSAASAFDEAYQNFADIILSGSLFNMNVAGVSGRATDIKDFMAATAQLKTARARLESMFTKWSIINKNTLPSNYTVIATENTAGTSVPLAGNVNLEKLVAQYKALLDSPETGLTAQLAQLTAVKIDVNGQVLTSSQYKDLLNPDFSTVPSLSLETIGKMTADVKALRSQAANVGLLEKQNFVDGLKILYNGFGERYGADYKYVPRSGVAQVEFKLMDWTTYGPALFQRGTKAINGSDKARTQVGTGGAVAIPGLDVGMPTDIQARNEDFQNLVNIFWMRSYLRKTYGIQLCAPQPLVQVAPSMIGPMQAVEALKGLKPDMACAYQELLNARQSARKIIEFTAAQSKWIFNGDGDQHLGLMGVIGSATTFFKGDRASAEAFQMLSQLIYADIEEEIMLATPGKGLASLRDFYQARYQSTPEMKAKYSSMRCSLDFDSKTCTYDAYNETVSAGQNPQDPIYLFNQLVPELRKSTDVINQASRINAVLEMFRAKEQPTDKGVQGRRGDG